MKIKICLTNYSLSVISPCCVPFQCSILQSKNIEKKFLVLLPCLGCNFLSKLTLWLKDPAIPVTQSSFVFVLLSVPPVSPAVNPHLGHRTNFGRKSPATWRAGVRASVWVSALRGCPAFCLRVKQACVLQPWLYPPTSTSVCLCDLLQPSASLSLSISGYSDFIEYRITPKSRCILSALRCTGT